ncbi:MAG: rhamnulokinase [Clostridia bacterium]|nr:rhamnulokinase [Clostridia bacterium]
MDRYLAVDIGASSGRHILGHVEDGRIVLEQVYRFENRMMEKDGHICWDVDALFAHILAGLRAAKDVGKAPVSLGIDTWGVDFVLLNEQGQRIGDAVAYRDKRTEGMEQEVERIVPFPELYEKTGIQRQPFNTIYQLMALKRAFPQRLAQAHSLLMMPDYLGFLLTGAQKQEYTIASTSGLLDVRARAWETSLLDALGLPRRLFGELSMPGASLGGFTDGVRAEVGFDCQVLLPATHDTGSAFVAIPARGARSVYLSSGTWSLLGVEQKSPVTTQAAWEAGFTNEGGYGKNYRFLQNIMGLWMLQSIRRDLGGHHTYPELAALAREAEDFPSVIDVNHRRFLTPDNMLQEVKGACADTGQPVPGTAGQALQCVYRSLAHCYGAAITALSGITGVAYENIHIVGGGSQDAYLNQLTANATGLPLYAGPVEGTALGNLIAQMIACGVFRDVAEARDAVSKSFPLQTFLPQ